MSYSDKERLKSTAAVANALQVDEDEDTNLMAEHGYEDELHEDQVQMQIETNPVCNYIQPVPSQILTLHDQQNNPIHIDLDSGATVSYAKLQAVLSHGFKSQQNYHP